MKDLTKSFMAVIILIIGMFAVGTYCDKRESRAILVNELIEEGFVKDEDNDIWRCSVIESEDDLYINLDVVYFMDENRGYMTGNYRYADRWSYTKADGTVETEIGDIQECDNVWIVVEWDYESNDWNTLEREGI